MLKALSVYGIIRLFYFRYFIQIMCSQMDCVKRYIKPCSSNINVNVIYYRVILNASAHSQWHTGQ